MRSSGQDIPDPTDYTRLPHPSRILTLLQLRAGREQAKAAALQSLPWREGKEMGQVWINPPPRSNSELEGGTSRRGNQLSYWSWAIRRTLQSWAWGPVRGEHGEWATPTIPTQVRLPTWNPTSHLSENQTHQVKPRRSPFGEKDRQLLSHS